jgi:hypothetical protein
MQGQCVLTDTFLGPLLWVLGGWQEAVVCQRFLHRCCCCCWHLLSPPLLLRMMEQLLRVVVLLLLLLLLLGILQRLQAYGCSTL